jgi:DNA-binding winged helix-turn-helix (wHTH) protein
VARQSVEESDLTAQIAALRRVLGEIPGGDRWIETMHRLGIGLSLRLSRKSGQM